MNRRPRSFVLGVAFLAVLLTGGISGVRGDEGRDLKGPLADALLPDGLAGLRVGLNLMVGYTHDDSPVLDQFVTKRAYLDFRIKPQKWLEVRVTPDVYPDDDGIEYRLKYGYGKLQGEQAGFIHKPYVEIGMVHTPWLEFEEHINVYRLQDPLYQERVGLITSADVGLTVGGLFGAKLDKRTIEALGGSPDPGRYGSVALGVYNGAGYYSAEQNSNKTLMSRLSLRPLPDHLPGFQISHHFIFGRGNRTERFPLFVESPDSVVISTLPLYMLNGLMLSFEQRNLTVAVQGVTGSGNRQGTNLWMDASTGEYHRGESLEYLGGSVFLDIQLAPYPFALMGRFDRFDRDVKHADNGLDRLIGGIAYRPDKTFLILLDVERTLYESPLVEDELRVQVMMQFKTL